MWKTGRKKERLGEQQEWHRTTERIARSPAILPANVHFATSSTTPETHPPPSPLTVTMATLCFPAQSLEDDCLSQSSNKPQFRINTPVCMIQTIHLCVTTFYSRVKNVRLLVQRLNFPSAKMNPQRIHQMGVLLSGWIRGRYLVATRTQVTRLS